MEHSVMEKKILNIIKTSLKANFNIEEIAGENLISECGINSIDALEIFLNIENEFNIQIEDEDLSSELLGSLKCLCNYVFMKKDYET